VSATHIESFSSRWPNGTTTFTFRGSNPVAVLLEAQRLHATLDPWLRDACPQRADFRDGTYVASVTQFSAE